MRCGKVICQMMICEGLLSDTNAGSKDDRFESESCAGTCDLRACIVGTIKSMKSATGKRKRESCRTGNFMLVSCEAMIRTDDAHRQQNKREAVRRAFRRKY